MKKPNSVLAEPKLAQPGAGISLFELSYLKFYIKPFVMRNLNTAKALQNVHEGQSILTAELQSFKPNQLTKRVLVNRPLFVEDSSRHWSAAMLCNHIAKVNGALAKAIENKFTAEVGQNYNPKDRLKAVKPDLEKNEPTEIDVFNLSVTRLCQAVERETEMDLHKRFVPHPWFGSLSHLQWVWFAGFHMKIHAKQLKQIKLGINS